MLRIVISSKIRTSDGGYASVGAEVHFCIKDAALSRTAVQDLNHSLRMLAQTTLVNSLASRKLIEVQHDRKFINKQVQVTHLYSIAKQEDYSF